MSLKIVLDGMRPAGVVLIFYVGFFDNSSEYVGQSYNAFWALTIMMHSKLNAVAVLNKFF